jgi:hypothetical protein
MIDGTATAESRTPWVLHGKTVAGIAMVSLLYFADILLWASRKPFWFEDLYTVYLCRLFHS